MPQHMVFGKLDHYCKIVAALLRRTRMSNSLPRQLSKCSVILYYLTNRYTLTRLRQPSAILKETFMRSLSSWLSVGFAICVYVIASPLQTAAQEHVQETIHKRTQTEVT